MMKPFQAGILAERISQMIRIRSVNNDIQKNKDNDKLVVLLSGSPRRIYNDILDIIEDLKTTLIDGFGLGISEPKIGINKRIIVVGAKRVTDKDGFATKENRKKYNL